MINLQALSKAFGKRKILDELTIEVQRQETVVLLGPNGSGKTTTLNIIAGLIPIDAGQIFIDGELVEGLTAKGKPVRKPPSARKLGYIFQSLALFPHMTVHDNIAYGLKELRMSAEEVNERIGELLEFVGLTDYGKYYPRQLSGGQKQRAALARSIAIKPEILLLDEPLSAVDAQFKTSLRRAIKEFLQRLQITTIYVTHDVAEAISIADRIAILKDGRIEQVGSVDEVRSNPKSKYVADFFVKDEGNTA
jgi:sulfate transport system ATP-binding protein